MWIPIFSTFGTNFNSESFTTKTMNWKKQVFKRREHSPSLVVLRTRI